MAIPPESVRVFAPAKINLFLHVIGKRFDGYHDLQSLAVFADIGDMLHIERAGEFSLTVDGSFAADLAGEADNLVLKAARAFARGRSSVSGAHFRLTKNLPVASGIGGGSADAAAALRGLAALYGHDLAEGDELASLAAAIGSDIPVCLKSHAAWMEGRGERVVALPPLPELHLVLVNPRVAVSTQEVFGRLKIQNEGRELNPPGDFSSASEFVDYLAGLRNDLESPACAIAPAIGGVLDGLRREGAALARMSGSGATCFGLFETAEHASHAASALRASQPGWWVQACGRAAADMARPKLT